jgi:pSer/pThr/pTyr-binding forkhead associated (FHA) protein
MSLRVRLIERGSSPEQTREIPIDKPEFLIGRATDCDLRLRVSEISRHHCIIRLGSAEATLVDLGSSNGTFVNGQRVRSQSPLRSGDELQIASHNFLVDLGDAEGVNLGITDVDPLTVTLKLPRK